MVKYLIFKKKASPTITVVAEKGLVASVELGDYVIVARYGVNKGTLRKILKKKISE